MKARKRIWVCNKPSASGLVGETQPNLREARNRMSSEGLINVCQAVKHGDLRQVTHLRTGREGVVIDVAGDELTVQTGQTTEIWAYQDCE